MLRSCLIICLLFMHSLQAQGFDFGKVGTSFRIKEEGFISMMMRKLKEVDLIKEQEKMKEISRKKVEDPNPVESIKPAEESREWWHDPTYILPKDIVLPDGKILYKAGTTVNPLDHMELERRLFFIDGREQAQIKWLKEQLNDKKEDKIEDRIILVTGSVLKLQEEIEREIYFDQSGEITGKWGIHASPAVADQDGKMIRIREVELDKLR